MYWIGRYEYDMYDRGKRHMLKQVIIIVPAPSVIVFQVVNYNHPLNARQVLLIFITRRTTGGSVIILVLKWRMDKDPSIATLNKDRKIHHFYPALMSPISQMLLEIGFQNTHLL